MQTYTDQGRKLLTFIKYSLKQEQHLQHEAIVLKPTVIPLDQSAVQRCADQGLCCTQKSTQSSKFPVRGTHAAVGLGSTDLSSACMSTTVAVVRFPAFPSVLQTGSKLPKPDQSLHVCPRAMSPCSFRSSAIQYSSSMLISMMKRDAVGWKLVHTAHDELRADGVELIPDARACSCTHYCHSQHRDHFICAIDNSDHCTVDTTNNAEWTCTVLSCSTCRSVNRSYIGWRIDV